MTAGTLLIDVGRRDHEALHAHERRKLIKIRPGGVRQHHRARAVVELLAKQRFAEGRNLDQLDNRVGFQNRVEEGKRACRSAIMAARICLKIEICSTTVGAGSAKDPA
jgi:hypothetical protein